MTRIAVHHWQHRIAPVFDIGGEILVLGDGAGAHEEHLLQCSEPLHRAEELCVLNVGTLICGAISRTMSEALAARGITVVGFVAGDLERVVAAWEHGRLDESFAMPGCRGAGRGRGGYVDEHQQAFSEILDGQHGEERRIRCGPFQGVDVRFVHGFLVLGGQTAAERDGSGFSGA